MKTKAKGNRNEHKTIKMLLADGYNCVRAAGSIGVFDVIGISATEILFIQVKSNRFPGKTEIELMKDFVCPANSRKIVHVWKDRRALPEIKEV